MHELLEDNSLIICPSSYQEEILCYLEKEKKLLNIKFMTLQEYIEKQKFSYDEKTLMYLIGKGIKVENALTFLKNMLYIENIDYHNEKLDYLVNLKRELDQQGLLYYDNCVEKMLQRFKIKIYGYGQIDDWYKKLFNNYQLIDYPFVEKKFDLFAFKNMEEEVEFVFQRIIQLLEKNIDINKIFLMNVDEEYYPLLKKYALLYHLDIDIPKDDVLIGTIVGKKIYEMVLENVQLEDIVTYLKENCDENNYSIFLNILNKYVDFSLKDVCTLIRYDLLNTKVFQSSYENVLRIKRVFDYVGNDEYIFLMGFNSPFIPALKQDIDYITDNIKNCVGLMLTEDENTLIKNNTLHYLQSITNIVISYKKVTPFNTYYPSVLLEMMNYEEHEYQRSYAYSSEANQNLYTSFLDDYVKYGIKNDNLDKLFYNYGENNYLEYNNAYNVIDKQHLMTFLQNELTLSYSSIDSYFKCSFKYYLSNVLKINLYEETFMTIIGNLFHDALRHMNDKDFDLENFYCQYLQEKCFTNKEFFFLEKLKKDLKDVIEVIKKHQFITGFNQMLYEEKIDIIIQNSPYVHFKGFVDKIMYREKDNETLVSIIDYKTGNPDIKINNLEFGLSMQLPIYLYLVKKSNLLKNMKFTGFYLQYILNGGIKKGKKTSLEQRMDSLKLHGYSTSNIDRLMTFDSTMENSEMIYGVKLNKNGEFSKSSHVLSDEEIDEIIKMTEMKIMEAMEKILAGSFEINPKILDGKNVSCPFCSFKDICYLNEKNKIYLVSMKDDDSIDEEVI